ncbi:unnamed protein product [Pleuronectes platessa]|uniref:Uncharacterized protein n=1 Tax=Pleuronectes platessa TaxID=8262 RepID=A0A9N7W4D2_PLEPL|nr:unnamed protein product [Pleuronectes platessa]
MDTAPRSKRKKAPAPAKPPPDEDLPVPTAPPAAARAQRFYHKYEHRPMISRSQLVRMDEDSGRFQFAGVSSDNPRSLLCALSSPGRGEHSRNARKLRCAPWPRHAAPLTASVPLLRG